MELIERGVLKKIDGEDGGKGDQYEKKAEKAEKKKKIQKTKSEDKSKRKKMNIIVLISKNKNRQIFVQTYMRRKFPSTENSCDSHPFRRMFTFHFDRLRFVHAKLLQVMSICVRTQSKWL